MSDPCRLFDVILEKGEDALRAHTTVCVDCALQFEAESALEKLFALEPQPEELEVPIVLPSRSRWRHPPIGAIASIASIVSIAVLVAGHRVAWTPLTATVCAACVLLAFVSANLLITD